MTKALLFIFSLSILFSCSNTTTIDKEKQAVNEEQVLVPKNKSGLLLNKLKPASQHFEINNSADTLISGKGGTLVFIPENSFVDAAGDPVAGNVEIELVEVLSIGNFVKLNLQTVSNGQLLQSQGMLFVNAKSNGQSILLAPGKDLQIELPKIKQLNNASDTKVFKGDYDSSGHINWKETGKIDHRLIPLPLDLFEYHFWTSFGFIRIPKNEGYQVPGNDEITDSTLFKQPGFANTFIATREFEERFWYIISAEWAIGHYTSYYSTTVQKGRMIKDSTISKIYLNNTDKNLWYCDSLAYNYMKGWVGKAAFNAHWYSEGENFDLLKAFKEFYEQRLTTTIRFPENIDLSNNKAREILKSTGYTPVETDEIIGAYERQKEIVTARRNRKTINMIETNAFAIAKLGWINCDQFYYDSNAKEARIIAKLNNTDNFDFVCFSLVINTRRIAVNGILNDKSEYCFTGNAKPYTKLPIGEKATIIGLSYKNDKPYFGAKEITLGENGIYKVELSASSIEDIENKLSKLN